MVAKLRIVTVNDVYKLENLPKLATFVKEQRKTYEGTPVKVTLPGDFLAPTLLSSLDRGRSMVAVMNVSGFDYVCFGNHEADVPFKDMLIRIGESKFPWINSNMPDLDVGKDCPTPPEYDLLALPGGDSAAPKRVAFLGFVSDDPTIYKKGRFNNCKIEPPIECAKKLVQRLRDEKKADVFVALTHQTIEEDREFAMALGRDVPLILGGHEHEYFDETHNGCRIIKTGINAETFVGIDLTVDDSNNVSIDIEDFKATDFKDDEESFKVRRLHESVLDELQKAPLCMIPKNELLTSRNIRFKQVTMGTLLSSLLRDAFAADCCLLNAGCIRADMDYPRDKTFFNYADLVGENPFNSEMTVVPLPGQVISDAVAFSRKMSFQDPPMSFGGYLQVDDKVTFDDKTRTVTHIHGKPIKPDELYETAVAGLMLEGMDNIEPLVEYANQQPKIVSQAKREGWPSRLILASFCSTVAWFQLGKIKDIDQNADGIITKDELRTALERSATMQHSVADVLVDNLMAVADMKPDGTVQVYEVLARALSVGFPDSFDVDANGILDSSEIKLFCESLIGQSISSDMVDKVLREFGCEEQGHIKEQDIREVRLGKRPLGLRS